MFSVKTGDWSNRGVADGMKFLDRHSAQDLCDLLNNSYFIARSIGADGCIPRPVQGDEGQARSDTYQRTQGTV